MSIFRAHCILVCFVVIFLISGCTDGDDTGIEYMNSDAESSSGDKTNPNANGASCTGGAIKCDSPLADTQNSTAYFVCNNGVWSEESTKCDEGSICSESDQKCIESPAP